MSFSQGTHILRRWDGEGKNTIKKEEDKMISDTSSDVFESDFPCRHPSY